MNQVRWLHVAGKKEEAPLTKEEQDTAVVFYWKRIPERCWKDSSIHKRLWCTCSRFINKNVIPEMFAAAILTFLLVSLINILDT